MLKLHWFVYVLLAFGLALANGDCGVCQPNGVVCHSENVYSLCVDGVISWDYLTCAEGHYCTTHESHCQSQVEGTPSCPRTISAVEAKGKCDSCSNGAQFACRNETAYSICHGENVFDTNIYLCEENSVCDVTNEQHFCSKMWTAQPSCRKSWINGVISRESNGGRDDTIMNVDDTTLTYTGEEGEETTLPTTSTKEEDTTLPTSGENGEDTTLTTTPTNEDDTTLPATGEIVTTDSTTSPNPGDGSSTLNASGACIVISVLLYKYLSGYLC